MSRGRCEDDELVVHLPDESPVLTPKASRILLGILVELTETETLDGSVGAESHDA